MSDFEVELLLLSPKLELWMEGMSNRAIANELKTTVGAVKMLKFRTMLKLKKELRNYNRRD